MVAAAQPPKILEALVPPELPAYLPDPLRPSRLILAPEDLEDQPHQYPSPLSAPSLQYPLVRSPL